MEAEQKLSIKFYADYEYKIPLQELLNHSHNQSG